MIDDIRKEAEGKMNKTLASLSSAFAKIRTGRAHPSLLDGISVSYYGTDTPLNQLANITVEDARTLVISPWEKPIIPDVEKAILKSDLGLNPSTSGDNIRLPMPPLTEENRRDLTKVAKADEGRLPRRRLRLERSRGM